MPVSLHASCDKMHEHRWADPHLMAHPLLTCRMLEFTTPGQEEHLQVDFAEIYRNSQLAK